MFVTDREYKNIIVKYKNLDIDIFDYDEVMNLCKIVIKKLISKYICYGLYLFNIYTNYQYGIIIVINKINDLDNDINIKIRFHIESIFLEEIDYFKYKDKNKTIYYYDDKFYIEYDKNYLEDSYILYGDIVDEILDNGIVINN